MMFRLWKCVCSYHQKGGSTRTQEWKYVYHCVEGFPFSHPAGVLMGQPQRRIRLTKSPRGWVASVSHRLGRTSISFVIATCEGQR